MGDGAGCVSVVSHMASLDSQRLFASAILQGCPMAVPFRGESESKKQAEAFAQGINCALNDLPCYRRKGLKEVLDAQSYVGAERYSNNMLMSLYPWGPTIDNIVVFYHPMDVFKDTSRFEKKPVIIGTSNEEGLRFVYDRFKRPLNTGYFHDFVRSATGHNSTWTVGNPMDSRAALVDFITEFVFECPSRIAAQKIGQRNTEGSASSTNVWLYKFVMPFSPITHSFPLLGPRRQFDSICSGFSCNGHDVRTLFFANTLPIHEKIDSRTLALQMVRYWSNFAKSSSVDGGIQSRSHLQTLQLGPVMLQGSQSGRRGQSPRARSQPRPTTQSGGPLGRLFLTGRGSANLRAALSTFTYWPSYSVRDVEGGDSNSTMLLQATPLAVKQNLWEAQCAVWDGFLV